MCYQLHSNGMIVDSRLCRQVHLKDGMLPRTPPPVRCIALCIYSHFFPSKAPACQELSCCRNTPYSVACCFLLRASGHGAGSRIDYGLLYMWLLPGGFCGFCSANNNCRRGFSVPGNTSTFAVSRRFFLLCLVSAFLLLSLLCLVLFLNTPYAPLLANAYNNICRFPS